MGARIFLNFHCPVPRSSSHIGPWLKTTRTAMHNRILYLEPSFGGRGCDEAEINEEKRLFTEWGPGIRWMKALLRNSTAKAIQWRGSGHSVNRRTPKIKISCQISAPIYACLCLQHQQFSPDFPASFFRRTGSWEDLLEIFSTSSSYMSFFSNLAVKRKRSLLSHF